MGLLLKWQSLLQTPSAPTSTDFAAMGGGGSPYPPKRRRQGKPMQTRLDEQYQIPSVEEIAEREFPTADLDTSPEELQRRIIEFRNWWTSLYDIDPDMAAILHSQTIAKNKAQNVDLNR